MRERALELLRSGLSVIPVKADGTKAPALSTFEEYKSTRRATEEEIAQWFPDGETLGVAVICGKMSDNLIVMDFETKEIFTSWQQLAIDEDLPVEDLPIVETPRGFHVYAKLSEPERGRKLASQIVENEGDDGVRRTKREVLIETRGDGQYVLGPGSPKECHPFHRDGWEHRWGPDVTETPKVSVEEWAGMIRCAQSFNEAHEPSRIVDGLGKITKDDQRPGTDFCRRASIQDFRSILEKHGWEMVRESRSTGRQIWKRPGKRERGGSATLGAVTTSLGECLYVFSTNAHPFEADTCYSIFAVRALLSHGGDFSKAASQCRIEGYGQPAPDELKEEIEGYVKHWRDPRNLNALEKKVENLCAVSSTFKKTWLGKRERDLGEDPHRYTRSILYQAAQALGTPEESGLCMGIGLVKLWRQRMGQDPAKSEDVDYLARQAADVLSVLSRNEAEAHAVVEAKEAGDKRSTRLSWLQEKFGGIPVERFIQYRGNAEEATYWLVIGGAQVRIGDIKSWETFHAFNRALRGWAGPGGTGIPGFVGLLPQSLVPRVAWHSVMIVLFQIREVEGLEDTTSQALFDWAAEFGEQYACFEVGEHDDEDAWRDAALIGTPFIRDGSMYLSLDNFLRWVNTRKGEGLTRRSIVDEMRAAGFKKQALMVRDDEGKRKQRHFWTVSIRRIPRWLPREAENE